MKNIRNICLALCLIAGVASCSPGYVMVAQRPPTPVYVRPAAPAPGYVWVEGEWYSSGGRYNYRNGYWARPRNHRQWNPGHWERGRGGYYWSGGKWR